uniref:KIAA1210-like protein n=1 Tax=Castor fiber TaxID=10185 RepID=A0A1D9CF01_CASFI|nr:KIAA1210-like protein [Castor fiber]
MAEPVSEVSCSQEVLEANDEGKKKSKFKALRSFFGKKKKKEPEDAQGRRMLKPNLSSNNISISSMKPVQEDQPVQPRPRSNMGNKALSHDSIFVLEPDPERSAGELCSPSEPQRGRPLQRSFVTRTLPRVGTSNAQAIASGAACGSVARYRSKSGIWVASSKVTEIPPLRPCQTSLSPPLIQSSTVSKDLGEISGANEPTKNPQKKSALQKMSKKQKQEEPGLPLVSEEIKTTTKPKEADQKKPKKDSSGPSSQEQSKKAEMYVQKTIGQASNTDTVGSQSYPVSAGSRKRHRRKGTIDYGSKKKGLIQPSQEHSLSTRAEFLSTNKTARDPPFWYQPLEKQVMDQLVIPRAETITPQELFSDKGGVEKRNVGIGFEAKKASVPQPLPEAIIESMVSDPPPHHEDKTKKPEVSASLLPLAERPSTTQEISLSAAAEAQVLVDPSHIQSEEEEASIPDFQKVQSKPELAQGVPTICKEKLPGNVFQAFTANALEMADTTADGGASMERLPPRSLSQSFGDPETEEHSPDPKTTSEEENNSDEQPAPAHSFQPSWKPEVEQNVFPQSESLVRESSSLEQHLAGEYSSQFVRKPEDEEISSDSENASEKESHCEELVPGPSFQALEKHDEGLSESKSLVVSSISETELASRFLSHVLQESEGKEVSTESSSYVEQYNSAEDWSSSQEDLTLRNPHQALRKLRDQEKASLIPKNTLIECSIPAKKMPLSHPSQPIVKPTVQSHISSGSENISIGQSGSVETVPSSYPFQPWASPKFEQQVSADPQKAAVDWGIFMEPLPPRKTSKHLRPKVEQKLTSSPEIPTLVEVPVEILPPRHHSQPLTKPIIEQEVLAGVESTGIEESTFMEVPKGPSQSLAKARVKKEVPLGKESAAVEGTISVKSLPPKPHSQPLMGPFIEQQFSAGPKSDAVEGIKAVDLRPPICPFPESAAVEGDMSMEPLPSKLLPKSLTKPKVHQNMFSGSEGLAGEMVISVDPVHSKCSSQVLTNPQGQPISQCTVVEETTLMKPLTPGCPSQPLVKSKCQPQMPLDSVSTSSQQGSPMEPGPAKHVFQPWANPKFKQQVSAHPESAEAEGSIPKKSASPRRASQPWLLPTLDQVPAGPERAAIQRSISMEPMLPRISSQPSVKPIVKQPDSTESASAFVQKSSSVEPVPSRQPLQPYVNPTLKQVSVGLESSAAQGSISVELRPRRHHSQPPMRSRGKQEVSSDSVSACAEWSGPKGSMPAKYAYQQWVNPKSEQEDSAGAEAAVLKRSGSRDLVLPRHHSQSIMIQKAQKTSSSFEIATIAGVISGRSLPLKHAFPFSRRSKVKEISSRLENIAAAEDIHKKLQLHRDPTQSFVKFMAQQIFSESPAIEGNINVDPSHPKHHSQSLPRPQTEHQVNPDWGTTDSERGTPLNKPPMKQLPQSLGRPEDPQVFSQSNNAPVKKSSSKGQVPVKQKLECKQEVSSVSDNSPEDWKSEEGQLPLTYPSQALDGSEVQPQSVSACSVNVPGEWSSPEEPSKSGQAFGSPECHQQVFLGSKSAAAEGTTFEKDPGNQSLPKVQAPSKKIKKQSQDTEDSIKSTPTSATKPGKLIVGPAWKTTITLESSSKEEVLQNDDGNQDDHSSLPTSEMDDVPNIFGVRLKRIHPPQKYKSEERDDFTQLPSQPLGPTSSTVSTEQQVKRNASQRFLDTLQDVKLTSSSAEKQQIRPKSGEMAKKHPAYKMPGKPPGQQSDEATSEPAWIIMAKQKQMSFPVCVPIKESKIKSTAVLMAETKEPRNGAGADTAQKTPKKGDSSANENQPRKILTSSIHRQEKMAQMKLPKSTKSVAFEDQKTQHTSTMEKEPKRSLSLPARLHWPVKSGEQADLNEPVWFSLAKKKAKAWSHIAEIMQ